MRIFFFKKISYWKTIAQKKEVKLNNHIDVKFDEFWRSYETNYKDNLLQSRTATWVKWHFQRKLDEGMAWIISVNDSNKLLGYAVCSDTSNDNINLKRISLVDLVSLVDSKEVYLSLIKKCLLEAEKRGYHAVELVGYKNLKREIFSKFKPFKRKLAYPFFYKSKNKMYKNFLTKHEIWDPSLIDGDAFL